MTFLPDGREAPAWMPHDRKSFERLHAETSIFADVFIALGSCANCDWSLWDGAPHVDPPEFGFHSPGCRDPYHCGWCDTSEAIAELHYEMSLIDRGDT